MKTKLSMLSVVFALTSGFIWADVLQHLDLSVKPWNDFYNHANGNWNQKDQCSAGQEIYASLLSEATICLRDITKGKAVNPENQKTADTIKQLYTSFMNINVTAVNKSIVSEFNQINSINKDQKVAITDQILELVGKLNVIGVPVLFDLNTDKIMLSKSDEVFAFLDPSVEIPDVDPNYVGRLFGMLGQKIDADTAGKVVAIANQERAMAKKYKGMLPTKEVEIYGTLQNTPTSSITSYLQNAGLNEIIKNPETRKFIKYHKPYFDAVVAYMTQATNTEEKLKIYKSYLKFQFLLAYQRSLIAINNPTQNAKSEENALAQIGTVFKYELPRLCFQNNLAMPEIQSIVDNVKDAYRDNITKKMSEGAKGNASKLLDALQVEIAYPPRLKNPLLTNDDPVTNLKLINSDRYYQLKIDRISKKTGPIEAWRHNLSSDIFGGSATYYPRQHILVLPIVMLMPPFFQAGSSPYNDALNYGSLGVVIGHEISHAFEPDVDASGTVIQSNWMTEIEAHHFTTAYNNLKKQYMDYITNNPKENYSGVAQTDPMENIADVLGLNAAYYAYLKSLNGNLVPIFVGKVGNIPYNISGKQLFYYSFAEHLRLHTCKEDTVHSAPYYRVNGAVRNQDEFYNAFGSIGDVPAQPVGNSMRLKPDDRVNIW
ncbi:MAG: Peptidase [Burkholderiales bacterium]|jgi:predicted metalloendopeptidase|nr:Peptidase [Burkholderiales bacterium]